MFDGIHLLRGAHGIGLALPVEKKGAIQNALESLRNFTHTLGSDDCVMRGDREHSLQALLRGFAYMSHDKKRCRKSRLADTSPWRHKREYFWKWCI